MQTLSKEDKRNNFLRVSERRMVLVSEAIRKLSHVTNRHRYIYTRQEAEAIVEELKGMISNVESCFNTHLKYVEKKNPEIINQYEK